MPTLTVRTTVTDPVVRRRFAKHISMWMRGRGVDLTHVLTEFHTLEPDAVFSGPFPLAAAGPEPRHVALVRCVVSRDRTREFLDEAAVEIARGLAPDVPRDRVFVHFEPIDPLLHHAGPGDTGPRDSESKETADV
ncbi:hypothetical protein ACGF1Z_21155 [Streptomyces sp. NPDC048018]|uniref:hypothetical protein n=1 Tax=Streptomyces sp. NPDC048018 TaxID=3365499 RepID=UPI003720CE1D